MTAPPTSPSVDPSPSRHQPGVGNSAFWKKRIARALLLGAVLFAASWVLPEVPTEQHLEVRAPEGYHLSSLSIAYFAADQPEVLSGIQLQLRPPASQAFHDVRLKNGTYRIVVQAIAQGRSPDPGASAKSPTGASRVLESEEVVPLSGERVRILLDD